MTQFTIEHEKNLLFCTASVMIIKKTVDFELVLCLSEITRDRCQKIVWVFSFLTPSVFERAKRSLERKPRRIKRREEDKIGD